MKGNPVLPGGSLKSKPTWGTAQNVPHVVFFAFGGKVFTLRGRRPFSQPGPQAYKLCRNVLFFKHKGNETMIHKKVEGKKLARSHLSLAARILGGAVRDTPAIHPPEEAWRNKKLNRTKCFKR